MRSGSNTVSLFWHAHTCLVWVYVREGDSNFTNFQKELGISNSQFGLVSGALFTMTNSFSSLILGYQVDKFNRKYLLIASCFTWNVLCGLSYFITSYGQMCVIRMGFAVISSVHTPACISLIGDYFEHHNRSKANSVYVAAISFGVGLANITSLINQSIGWRECSLVVSGIGIFMSLLALGLQEPARTDDRGNQLSLETKVGKNELARHHSEPDYRFTSLRQTNNAMLEQVRMQSVMSLQNLERFDNELGDLNNKSKSNLNYTKESKDVSKRLDADVDDYEAQKFAQN